MIPYLGINSEETETIKQARREKIRSLGPSGRIYGATTGTIPISCYPSVAANIEKLVHPSKLTMGLRSILENPTQKLSTTQVRINSNRSILFLFSSCCWCRWDLPGSLYDRSRGNRRNWYAIMAVNIYVCVWMDEADFLFPP